MKHTSFNYLIPPTGTIIFLSALMVAFTAGAQQVKDVEARNVVFDRNGDNIVVDFDFDFRTLDVESNRAVLITPRIVNGNDSVELRSVGIYGRRRYYYYVRNGIGKLTGRQEIDYRSKERPDTLGYRVVLPFSDWMNSSELRLHRSDFGCCNEVVAEYDGRLGRYYGPIIPPAVYIRNVPTTIKTRELSGSARVDFPVSRTEIFPDYHNNAVELAKINATIDSVKSDPDIVVDSVWLKGYASPESPYSNNKRLAMGRTDAIRTYINRLHNFKSGVVHTDYEPENWEGLREYVDQSQLEHRTEILSIIDSYMEPDPKEAYIKRTFPSEYRFLLQNCYPMLRRTYYRIVYTIRAFTDVDEMKRILKTAPQKLSMNEFNTIAKTYDPQSPEFAEVFEIAVRMYPDDKIANLNAATTALQRNDLEAAKRYVAKAGDLPEVTYVRASIALKENNTAEAERLFRDAYRAGIDEAKYVLDEFESRKEK